MLQSLDEAERAGSFVGLAKAVWLCHFFSLNLREVEAILARRGIVLGYRSIRT